GVADASGLAIHLFRARFLAPMVRVRCPGATSVFPLGLARQACKAPGRLRQPHAELLRRKPAYLVDGTIGIADEARRVGTHHLLELSLGDREDAEVEASFDPDLVWRPRTSDLLAWARQTHQESAGGDQAQTHDAGAECDGQLLRRVWRGLATFP